MKLNKTATAAMALLVTGAALADITIGVSLPLTGPASGLGIPVNQQMKLWPTNQFAGHGYDAELVLEKIIPVALKKAKPGTPEFRVALRDAMENIGRTVVSHGVVNWTKDDHWGYTPETGVMLKVVNGDWKVE